MPALPILDRPRHFERGDHLYLVAPVQAIKPTNEEVAAYAFGEQVRKQAPNENIVWFKGQYVEADNANANGAQWQAEELAIKSLTPLLMPVTVMHDPRTAVGVIADAKLLTPDADKVPRSRIDTVLALWGHRFPDAVHEAQANADEGTLMQSMECYSPWYACSECGATYHKLPKGAEQAQWCEHLKASSPSAGYTDLGTTRTSNASRILGDVCFTGTGLIFGTRGARGAYSDAFLSEFEDELASHHFAVHTAPPTSTPPGSAPTMGLVQIEQSELDILRRERDEARSELAAAKAKVTDLEPKVPALEAKVTELETKVGTEKARADEAETKVGTLEETAAATEMKSTRIGALGAGFMAKLGETSKSILDEKAEKASDEEWEKHIKMIEETANVARDAPADGSTTPPENQGGNGNGDGDGPVFSEDELAKLGAVTGGSGSGSSDEGLGSIVAAYAKSA